MRHVETAPSVILVTGGSRGLGKETARQLARAGERVVLTARRLKDAQGVADELKREGLSVDPMPLDVTREKSIQAAFRRIRKMYGRLDVLVNNAAVLLDASGIGSLSPKNLQNTLSANTFAPLRLVQVFLPLLQKSDRAQVINVSSGYGSVSQVDKAGHCPAYAISKAGLDMVTRLLAADLKAVGVAVNAVCPGWVRTDMGGAGAASPVEEGASGIVSLARKKSRIPTDKFFQEGKVLQW